MRSLIFLSFLLFSYHFYAQSLSPEERQFKIDSLQLELNQTDNDSLQLDIMMLLAYHWEALSIDSAKAYIEKGLSYPFIDDHPIGKAKLLFRKGRTYFSEDYDEAIKSFKASNDLYIQEGKEHLLYPTYCFLVDLYSLKRDLDSTLYYQELALKFIPKDAYDWDIYLEKTVINLYQKLGQYEVALKRFYRLETSFQDQRDSTGLGWLYYDIGTVWIELENLDSASYYYNKALGFKKHLVPWQYGSILGEVGSVALKKGKIEEALDYAEQSIQWIENENEPQILATTYSSYAFTLNEAKRYKKAAVFGNKALQILKKLKLSHSHPEIYESLVISFQQMGDYKKAFEYQQEWFRAKEKLLKTENQRMLAELDRKYETSQKEAKIKLQNTQINRQKTINRATGIIAFLVLILSFLLLRIAQRRKHVNFQLRQLDAVKSRFFSNISHELRTPLTLIIAPLENAIEKIKSKTAKEDLQLARDNSKKLLTLVNEILDLSKLEAGKMQLRETPVHFEKLLRRILFSYHSLAQLQGFILSFSYHLPKDLMVKLDVAKFEKVLSNLLSNAFKYSLPGGVITLRASEEKGNLLIAVNDTGKGINTENLEKIFERFYQVENENTPLQGGTGIGLAYAKEIAKLFGGDLTVESKVDHGSTFSFYFPMKQTAASTKVVEPDFPVITRDTSTSIKEPVVPQYENGERSKILIVEDNPEMSKFLVQTLSKQFNCTTAIDGQKALDLLHHQKFDLITSDVMMPNMDGFTFLAKVHEMDSFQHTPVILLTARALEEDKLRGFHLGVDDYLTKPFSVKELIARINNLLKNQALREAFIKESTPDTIEEKPLSFNQTLIKTAETVVLENLENPNFKIADLAKKLNYSQRQTERIIKKMTGLPPSGFVREIRLQKARQLIENRQFSTIAEVRYKVGFENGSYFSKVFLERFGKKPSDI
ncbi:MAG: response regulator [Chitinophagales bacterium]|nr:response regulator [Chitinophagales bacterium]